MDRRVLKLRQQGAGHKKLSRSEKLERTKYVTAVPVVSNANAKSLPSGYSGK